jgi:lipopolysaccharide/colanic/teichoic acid biosynthesis glycosyltransferase
MLHITEPRVDTVGRRLVAGVSRLAAIPLVLLASPVLILVALAMLISSGRPILFRQERVGYRGRSFEMLKFRTMVPNAEKLLVDLRARNEHDGPLFKMRDDPRITGIGKWLRRYSIDELPQLLNVLRGDMVFVGPRPCLPNEIENFGESEHRRFFAKPGLTGLWQVSGRSRVGWDDAVRLDLYYVDNWSPGLDLLILLRTLRVVLAGTGY